ncbi:hypothetical protein K2X92_05035 [Candidatus Gracilibacteria bacterium]|nr:hypothetical protein [Candidatus Gracilibacteria bacterium]
MSILLHSSDSRELPIIDEAFLDSQLEIPNNTGVGGIHDITVSDIQSLMSSPIDAFLSRLSKSGYSIDQIIDIFEKAILTSHLIEKYHDHWLKIKKSINNPIGMIKLLDESFLQNIENKPNYKQQGFDPEYMKIIIFIQSLYQKETP